MPDHAITTEGLVRRFDEQVAVDEVDLAVATGEIYGFLGPNGAGKSTTVLVLCTLLAPSGGRAVVAGYDVATDPGQVRLHIGVALQDAALDPRQTGVELLRLQGRLYGLSKRSVEQRVTELAELIDIGDALGRRIETYSGGMKRRLDLAAALIHNPDILFLDEPTTGLDPTSRQRVWEAIRELLGEGVTILLTTQYLEEADELAHQIVVVDHGRVIADGTPQSLKEAARGAHLDVTLSAPNASALPTIAPLVAGEVTVSDDGRRLSAAVDTTTGLATAVVRALDAAGVLVDNIEVRQPSLDDVFFSLTGEHVETVVVGDDDEGGSAGGGSAGGAGHSVASELEGANA
jgi:ABC-2 type transport system ATP-binding protein